MNYLLILVMFFSLLSLSVFVANLVFKKGRNAKKVLAGQFLSFLLIPLICMGASTFTTNAETVTDEAGEQIVSEEASTDSSSLNMGIGLLAMALSIGLGCLGAGKAVAAAVPAAIGATSEDPKNFGKALVLVALAEGIPAFALLVSMFILFKLS